MRISDKGLKLIKDFEGLNLKRYLCPAGLPTIGFGHLLTEEDGNLTYITPEKADQLLEDDLKACYSAISALVSTPLAQGQFDALVSFIFNLGAGRFENSTLRKMINRGNYAGASLEFGKWVFSNKKVVKGLVRRRKAEQDLFNNV